MTDPAAGDAAPAGNAPAAGPAGPPAAVSVVLCSLNGEARIQPALDAIARQTMRDRIELIVVDDGSTDATARLAAAAGAEVIRHPVNRGAAAARNTGVGAARGDIVAFTDDDCRPEPDWIERLLAGYADQSVVGVGGATGCLDDSGFLLAYLAANNPLAPLEQDLAVSTNLGYRFLRYLVRNARSSAPNPIERSVFAFVGANMSFRRTVLIASGGFDERFRYGGEEEDLCKRMVEAFGPEALRYRPGAVVNHEFDPDLGRTLRRSFAYGRGNARMFLKHPELSPTIYPYPILAVLLAAASVRRPRAAVAALALPFLAFPRHLRAVADARSAQPLAWPFIQLAQEAASDLGFVLGYRASRAHFRGVAGHSGMVPAPRDTLDQAAAAGHPADRA